MSAEKNRTRLARSVIDFARKRLSSDDLAVVEPFLRHYFDSDNTETLQVREIANFYGAALAHWKTAQNYVSGHDCLRVYNPSDERDGWHSEDTVVEIVTDDIPFLIESVCMEVNRQELIIRSFDCNVFRVSRGESGSIDYISHESLDTGTAQSSLESFVRISLERCDEPAKLDELRINIERVLGEVRAVVDDWSKIVSVARGTIVSLRTSHSSRGDLEAAEFLEWMIANHFIFLGQRDYALTTHDGELELRGVPGSGSGILRESLKSADEIDDLIPHICAVAATNKGAIPVFLTKANSRATVHHPAYMDCVGVELLGPDGNTIGERIFLGLYTSSAYSMPTSEIPIVRRKCNYIVRHSGFQMSSPSSTSLLTLLDEYPRDDLFQAHDDVLLDTMMGMMRVHEHQCPRLFIHRGHSSRFFWCYVLLSRKKCTSELLGRISSLLLSDIKGDSIDMAVIFSESVPLLVHFFVHVKPGEMPEVETGKLEARLVQLVRQWDDSFEGDQRDAVLQDAPAKATISIVRPRVKQDELKVLLAHSGSPYADYVCTLGLNVALRTPACKTLEEFIYQLTLLSGTKVEIAWPNEPERDFLTRNIGVLGVFGSGAVRSVGRVIDLTGRGLLVEILDGVDLLDPDDEQSEFAYENNIESLVTLLGVEVF